MRHTRKTPFKRSERVGDQIAQVISCLIVERISDPRVTRCHITGVDVTADLRLANIHFSILEESEALAKDSLRALAKAAGFFRKEIGQQLKLRYTPDLRFFHDPSVERGTKMVTLIEKVISEDEKRRNDSEDPESD